METTGHKGRQSEIKGDKGTQREIKGDKGRQKGDKREQRQTKGDNEPRNPATVLRMSAILKRIYNPPPPIRSSLRPLNRIPGGGGCIRSPSGESWAETLGARPLNRIPRPPYPKSHFGKPSPNVAGRRRGLPPPHLKSISGSPGQKSCWAEARPLNRIPPQRGPVESAHVQASHSGVEHGNYEKAFGESGPPSQSLIFLSEASRHALHKVRYL